MRRIGNQHLLPRIPVLFMVRANQEQPGQLALRPRRRLQRNRIHPGNFQQTLFQQLQHLQATLRKLLRLIRMLRRNSIQPRHKLIHPRVVFHRARTQRIHPQINRVIPGRKPREVPDHLDLTNLWKSLHALAPVRVSQRLRRIHRRHIQRRQFKRPLPRRRLLKYQSLILIRLPRSLLNLLAHLPLLGELCVPQRTLR